MPIQSFRSLASGGLALCISSALACAADAQTASNVSGGTGWIGGELGREHLYGDDGR